MVAVGFLYYNHLCYFYMYGLQKKINQTKLKINPTLYKKKKSGENRPVVGDLLSLRQMMTKLFYTRHTLVAMYIVLGQCSSCV